ncbi:MAG: hypoxanthine phosphoribosyltransferase [Gemmatimonadetes bacterium]|nr:hypoxanthine phosphoribosyltransferase [Gemmatimonadota bacterium]NNF12565.1 hypoxanthine phosphoribosyltransferase [Gemmatimonadota bacterium]
MRGVVFDAHQIQARVRELAAEISEAYGTEDRLLVLCLLKGAFLFTSDLVRHITLPVQLDFMVAASYGDAKETSGEVTVRYDPPMDLTGRAVLLVEDIIDTGTTLAALVPRLVEQGAARVDVCALLHKREPTAVVEARWVGFDAPNSFLVGYGLDHAEDFRQLPYIASL